MKKITILLFIFFLPVIFIFVSCRQKHYRTIAIEVFAVKQVPSGYEEVQESVITSLTIEIKAVTQLISRARSLNNLSQQLNAAYDPPEDVYDNSIVLEKTQLILDKDIYYNGELIEKGTDLRAHSAIKEHTWLELLRGYVMDNAVFAIGFDKQFYDNVNIPEDEYTLTIICHTDDDLELEDSVTKTIKLHSETVE